VDDLLRGSPWADRGLNEVILTFVRTYLLDDILFKVDRASMYTSLEVRAPFLDVGVVELINSLPDSYKQERFGGKKVLKRLMRGKLPDSIIDRPKKGFGIPLSSWLRHELRPLCEDLLSEPKIRKDGLLNPREVARLRDEHIAGRANHRKKLWTLMAFRMWQEAMAAY
jgi:asparagine synthase (glutamine-hydrolysing)